MITDNHADNPADNPADTPTNHPSRHPANPPDHVQSIIDSICELGCDRVNDIIDALEGGSSVMETAGLDNNERQWVLLELKKIMAVYDRNQT